ncbi:TetR/AcrR family transcriptional regulator [Mitsuaria sp. CC2]|uniref:TetR/AcrR family transcriptional regulator n=1 Tax=Mitsuaria sp. CC2 TaxID=3029186 RepID=UPI003B8D1BAA
MTAVNSKEAILSAARQAAQAHGYAGLNMRDLATAVGIKAASIYHHFPGKADLATAVAQRYREDTAADLETLAEEAEDPLDRLRRYPRIFRRSLENGNRLCLCSFMSAEYEDLPDSVKTEVQAFGEVNVAWLAKVLKAAGMTGQKTVEQRAKAIFAAVSGAQLMARSRADLALFDTLIDGYRVAGLLAP